MKGITLWIFGGIAELDGDPKSATHEFLMPAAGPLASFVLASIFFGISLSASSISIYIRGLTDYLLQINLILAVFYLISPFPIDRGRILRSVFDNGRVS